MVKYNCNKMWVRVYLVVVVLIIFLLLVLILVVIWRGIIRCKKRV